MCDPHPVSRVKHPSFPLEEPPVREHTRKVWPLTLSLGQCTKCVYVNIEHFTIANFNDWPFGTLALTTLLHRLLTCPLSLSLSLRPEFALALYINIHSVCVLTCSVNVTRLINSCVNHFSSVFQMQT